jgi:hypothetical protein
MFCCCPGDKIKEEAKHKPHIKRSYEDPEVDHDSDEENEQEEFVGEHGYIKFSEELTSNLTCAEI